jgi:hypothetical protein
MAGKIRKSNLHDDVKTMVTDMISEQAIDSANFNSVLSSKTTDDISEGDNLYYTSVRFDSDFTSKSTSNLTEGSNLYYTTARGDSDTGVYISGDRSYGNITTTGYIRGPSTFYIDPAPVDSDAGLLVIRGDLQVDGTTTTVNSTTVSINDKNIVLADSAANASEADGAGITINGASATISYDAAEDKFDFNKNIKVESIHTETGIIHADDDDTSLKFLNNRIYMDRGGNRIFDAQTGDTRVNSPSGDIGVVVDDDGKVGIGLASPSYGKLHIFDNNSDLDMNANAQGQLHIDGNGYGFGIALNTEGANIYTNSASRDIILGTDETERVRIDGNGKVGIGTESPVYQLHVNSGATNVVADFESTDGIAAIRLRDNAGNVELSASGNDFRVQPAGSTAEFVVKNSGNVGIGTTNPSEKLTVNGIIASSSTGYSANVNTANFGLYTSGTNPTTYVQMPASGEFHVWKPSTAAALIVKNNGDVSIGSDHAGFSGWKVLNIRQNSTGGMLNFEEDDGVRAFTFANQGSGMRYQAHISGGYHRFETHALGAGTALMIKDDGNVGIGTGSPTHQLHVNGQARVKSLLTDVIKEWNITGSYSSGTAYVFSTRSEINGFGYGDGMYRFVVYSDTFNAGISHYSTFVSYDPFYFTNTGSNTSSAFTFNWSGVAMGHAPNTANRAVDLVLRHKYGVDATYPANQTFEFIPTAGLSSLSGVNGHNLRIRLYKIG